MIQVGVIGARHKEDTVVKKYVIKSINYNFETIEYFETDNPGTAINKWLSYSRKYPLNTAIFCGTREDVVSLYKVFVDKRDYYREQWYRKGIRYNYDYIFSGVYQYKIENSTGGFCGRRDWYDQVPYFSYG